MPDPSRSSKRRQHKRLARSLERASPAQSPLACRWLAEWNAEAIRAADQLGRCGSWGLLSEQEVVARLRRLDPSGELRQELARLIAEAVARASDGRLVRGCRPVRKAVKRKG